MSLSQKAEGFANLHVKGKPVALYNAWDTGSAKAILAAGAQAIATSSSAVAGAQGYDDGELIPFEFARQIIGRIAASIEAPVTVDFEGGYSDDDSKLARNTADLLDTGIIGLNFEDRVVKGSGLYDMERQARRISIIRKVAEQKAVQLFINARTDVFFKQGDGSASAASEALKRGEVYAEAGASGLFVPGLTDSTLIGRICEGSTMPVNVMMMNGLPSYERLSELGVARVSYGALPYQKAMKILQQEAEKVLP
jgi:2-methylisocitrate lyase-like PEP mutase family enzyme